MLTDIYPGIIIEFEDPKTTVEELLLEKGKGSFLNRMLVTEVTKEGEDQIRNGLTHPDTVLLIGFDRAMHYKELTVRQYLENDVRIVQSRSAKELSELIFGSDKERTYVVRS